jgi:hypothetical protein
MHNYSGKDYWFKTICDSINNDNLTFNGHSLPRFPEATLQINTTGQAGEATLCEAHIFYEDCIKRFTTCKNFSYENKSLMDFGVGWGRILRFFLKDFNPMNLHGVDINNDLLDVCRETFDWGNFEKSHAFPPINLPDNSVDFIVAYSVFSHLSEKACLEWVKEFSRLIPPGGMAAVTTRGRWFFDYCESLKATASDPYSIALSTMFDDFGAAKQRYDNGEIVHSNSHGVTGGGALDGSFYGETFIPEQYAIDVYGKYFKEVFVAFEEGRSTHPIVFLCN